MEKEALKSYFQKQRKTFTSDHATVSQNKMNLSPVTSSTKISSSKLSLSPVPKKQSNSPQVNFSSKLVSNGKLTSNECKKHLENNLCFYCSVGDHKLDFCPKKQTTVTSKGHSTLTTTDTLAATFEKPSEK